jgi:hypothetical protein
MRHKGGDRSMEGISEIPMCDAGTVFSQTNTSPCEGGELATGSPGLGIICAIAAVIMRSTRKETGSAGVVEHAIRGPDPILRNFWPCASSRRSPRTYSRALGEGSGHRRSEGKLTLLSPNREAT